MGAGFVDLGAVYFHQHRFVLIHAALGDEFAARIAGKALAPEFQSRAADRGFMACSSGSTRGRINETGTLRYRSQEKGFGGSYVEFSHFHKSSFFLFFFSNFN